VAANACYPTTQNHTLHKRLKFSLRLFYGYRATVKSVEAFFAETFARRHIMALPEFRERIYIQQVRPGFYRNSTSTDRAHFLQSHFQFLENTHKSDVVRNIYNELLPPISLQAEAGALSIAVGYHFSILNEGLLRLSVAMNNVDLYRITFWFMQHNGTPVLCIGALQGGQETLEANRAFTKEFWGLRPQNLAMTALRWYAQAAGVRGLYTFPKHRLWSTRIAKHTDLDQFWHEQGATPVEQSPFIELDFAIPRKALTEVPTRKRSAYKKRYEFLDNLQAHVAAHFTSFMQ
jgi:uncharacterized protein VirK/YbjX